MATWSMVHGLAMLFLDGPIRVSGDEAPAKVVRRATEILGIGHGGPALSAELSAAVTGEDGPYGEIPEVNPCAG